MSANPQWHDDLGTSPSAPFPARPHSDALWDKRAMARVAPGDENAMLLLYDRYSRLVYSLAVNVLRDKHVAEDVAQEVFLHIWRNARSFRPERGSLAGWLAVMTRHRAIDVLRTMNREYALGINNEGNDNAHRQAELSESVARLAAVLPSMPHAQRVALGLAYFSGLSHSEISSRIGEPLGTVKSRIRMALGFLRKTLSNRDESKVAITINSLTGIKRR